MKILAPLCVMSFCLLVAAVAVPDPVVTAADAKAKLVQEDWPDWRGVRRDGISRQTGLSLDWTAGKPKRLWQRELGTGYSSMTVVGDRLFTMGAEQDAEYVYCLDATDGSTLWKVHSGTTFKNSYGDGPRSTPIIEGERVYALGANGDLLCLAAKSGEVAWQTNILKQFGGKNIIWGVSTTPLIDGKKLVINVGAKQASVVAFDKTSGKVIWKSHDDVAGYSSPIRIDVPGDDGPVPHLVVWCGKSLVGLKPSDGSVQWKHEWLTTNDMNIATPIFEPKTRTLYVSASRGTGRCSAYRLTAAKGAVACKEIYTNKQMKNHYNSCVLLDGFLYGFDNNVFRCQELASGKILWTDRTVGKGAVISAQGHLIVLGEKGEMALVEATTKAYTEKGRFQALTSKRAWTPPALARGKLYVRDLERITCINIATAK